MKVGDKFVNANQETREIVEVKENGFLMVKFHESGKIVEVHEDDITFGLVFGYLSHA
jgi:hypothetical protein